MHAIKPNYSLFLKIIYKNINTVLILRNKRVVTRLKYTLNLYVINHLYNLSKKADSPVRFYFSIK